MFFKIEKNNIQDLFFEDCKIRLFKFIISYFIAVKNLIRFSITYTDVSIFEQTFACKHLLCKIWFQNWIRPVIYVSKQKLIITVNKFQNWWLGISLWKESCILSIFQLDMFSTLLAQIYCGKKPLRIAFYVLFHWHSIFSINQCNDLFHCHCRAIGAGWAQGHLPTQYFELLVLVPTNFIVIIWTLLSACPPNIWNLYTALHG